VRSLSFVLHSYQSVARFRLQRRRHPRLVVVVAIHFLIHSFFFAFDASSVTLFPADMGIN
jgi:hypothetical protein